MPTLGELISNIRHRLSGVGMTTGASMELVVDLPEDGLLVKVDNVRDASEGVYEIGLEKVRVKSIDRSSNSMALYTFGRGYEGSTVNFHQQGAEVSRATHFPAATIAQEINGVLLEMFPMIYGVKVVDAEYTTPFTMPADCSGIVAAFVSDTRAVDGWRRVDRYVWEPDSGQGLKIFEALEGTLVRIAYAHEPVPFDLTLSEAAETPWSLTGLPDRLSDLLTLGVAARLAPFADMGNLFSTGQSARSDQSKPAGRGARLASGLMQAYQQKLMQEQQVLHRKHPIRVHRER